jgi:hypothetical protein
MAASPSSRQHTAGGGLVIVEARWRRLIGPGIVSAGLLVALGPSASGAPDRAWDPPVCAGGGLARIVAARAVGPTAAADTPWFTLDPTLDASGSLTGQRLRLAAGRGAAPRRIDLPAESFAAGPFGRVVLVGDDDGQRSRLRLIDVVDGCASPLAEASYVIRRATISPDGVTIYETRVERSTRADLGVWRRPVDGAGTATLAIDPIDPDPRFGRTWSTEFAWSAEGDRLAIQSCGAIACRTRILDPSRGSLETVADPTLGTMVGLTSGRLVAYRSCRGWPCGLVSVDTRTRRRATLSEAAGAAVLTGRGATARVVHERYDRVVGRRLRVIDVLGRNARDLGAIPDGPLARPDLVEVSR